MTEKRFIAIDDGLDFMVRDIVTGDDLIDADGVADILNELHEEKQSLKKQNKRLHDDLHKINQIARGY